MSAWSDWLDARGASWWARLGEPSGTVMEDASPNNRDGTWNGAVTLGATGLVEGDSDTAVTFPGAATAYGVVPYASWMNSELASGFSMGAIFATTTTGAAYILQRWSDGTASNAVMGIDLAASNVVRVYVRSNGSNRILSATVAGLRTGARHLVGLTWMGGNLYMHIDGAPVTSMSAPAGLSAPTTTDLCVGRRNPTTTTNPFIGTIDEPFITTPMSDAEWAEAWELINGPTTPVVTWLHVGAVTDDGFTVTAKVGVGVNVELGIEAGSTLTTPAYGTPVASDANGYVKVSVTGLTPATEYAYGLKLDGTLDTAVTGHATTHPTPGDPYSFTFGHSSCIDNGSNHRVFDAIRTRDPLMFAVTGDFHYGDITSNSPGAYRIRYEAQHAAARLADLFEALPVDVTWDDHDFGADNSNKNSTSKPAAQSVYRQLVPHYPLDDSAGIWHSWQIGRVYFIATDLRSYRDPNGDAAGSSKTMMGTAQKAWFKSELLAADAAGAALIIWISSQVYNTDGTTGIDYDNDSWASFTHERAELADYIRDEGLAEKVFVVVGDAHMLAHDDGALSDFATGGGAPLPQFCAAALDRPGLVRGDNWSSGTHDGAGQFGFFTFTDDGDTLTWQWEGVAVDSTSGAETVHFDVNGAFIGTPTGITVQRWDGATLETGTLLGRWDGAVIEPAASLTIAS